jgi:predicted nucleotidyltransferase
MGNHVPYTRVDNIQDGSAGNIAMTEHIRQVVRKLIEGLGPGIEVVRVYAYGSRVRGDADLGSDLDLLVELRDVTRTAKGQILDRAWELSLEEGYVISVVIVSQEAFERGPLSLSGFARTIRQEGIEIAAREITISKLWSITAWMKHGRLWGMRSFC